VPSELRLPSPFRVGECFDRAQAMQMNVETHTWLHVGIYLTTHQPWKIEDSLNQWARLAARVKWAKKCALAERSSNLA
jgi:hypothetical protein